MSEEIIEVIKEQQRLHVRESYGQLAHECFTYDDLNMFKREGVPEEITTKLRRNKRFIKIVQSLNVMTASKRGKILRRAAKTYKPTWAKLGRITREGQTDAGQMTEKLIAHAIVELAQEMMGEY